MTNAFNIIVTFIQLHWVAIVSLFGGGAGLSVLLEVTLHKFHIDSKKAAFALINLLSLSGGIADYLVNNGNALHVYAGLVIAAQTVHRFLVSPAYTKYVEPFLNYQANQKAATAVTPAIVASPAVATAPTEFSL